MEWAPTAREDTAKLATPAVTVPVPSAVAPSRNWTLPVAVLVDSLAVNVTVCPKADGLADELKVTLEGALLTVWVSMAEVFALSFPSPPYAAVIACAPTARENRQRGRAAAQCFQRRTLLRHRGTVHCRWLKRAWSAP